jgi:GNAT superfamily N-acetyltransferase
MNKSNVQPLPHVRVAVAGDFNDLIRMGREVFAENGLMNLNEDMIRVGALRAIEGVDSVVGCIGPVGALEAAIHLSMRHFWYTDQAHLEELWAFVRPEFRKTRNAQALIEFAKNLAVELKRPLLIGVLSSHRTEAKVKMYRRKLGAPSGAYFLFNAETGVG